MSRPAIEVQNLNEYQKALQEYFHYNNRERGPLLEWQANTMRWALYRQFANAAPTRAELQSEIEARNYRIYRRDRDYHEYGVDGGLEKVPGLEHPKITYAHEVARRQRSRKYLSLGFLMREWRRSKEGQNVQRYQQDRVGHLVGRAIVKTKQTSNPSVELMNMLSGARKLNNQRALVARAVANQTAYIRKYIKKKEDQQIRRTIGNANRFVKELVA